MSTIVIVEKNGKAVIAADTMSTFGNDIKVTKRYLSNRDKILKCGETYLGVVGATSNNNVLRHIFQNYGDDLSFGDEAEIFETYLKLHTILKDEYFVNPKENDDDPYESSQIDALIANRSGIYGIYSLREVFKYKRFWALGSGFELAMGAMFAVYERLSTPEEIAEVAIHAACEFDNGSALPFTIYSIEMQIDEDQRN